MQRFVDLTLNGISNGAIYADPQQPTFSGTASSGFGISPTVTVRVYNDAGAGPTWMWRPSGAQLGRSLRPWSRVNSTSWRFTMSMI